MVRDFYHRYTVDEHTFVAIEAIDNLIGGRAILPRGFENLRTATIDHTIVRLALLLHDIGKGTRPGDHVRGSMDSAEHALARLGAPEGVRDAVLFLIDHHLDLSLIMNGRGLNDSATARFLTSRIGTQEDLLRLVLLTYADISAVNPTAMTPWRIEQCGACIPGLRTAHPRIDCEPNPSRLGSPSCTFTSPELNQFLEGFPKRYFRTLQRDDIKAFRARENAQRMVGGSDHARHRRFRSPSSQTISPAYSPHSAAHSRASA